MNDEIESWERKEGVDLIRKIGIEEGDAVLDFGAGYGHYTLPAAEVIGRDGMVFAVDKDPDGLSAIAKKASQRNFTDRIKTIKNTGDVTLKFKSNTIDHVLLFDILHIFSKDERKVLYNQIHDILKPGRTVSIYLKHSLEGDHSSDFHEKDKLIREMEDKNLLFDEEICVTLAHDIELVEGCVLNFNKKRYQKQNKN